MLEVRTFHRSDEQLAGLRHSVVCAFEANRQSPATPETYRRTSLELRETSAMLCDLSITARQAAPTAAARHE